MKLFILFTLLSILILPTQVVHAEYDTIYSTKGYPYDLLISRTEAIKIIYSVNDEDIHCKVVINWNKNNITSPVVQVSKNKFEHMPLASCLTRKQAKTILASTFNFDATKLLENSLGL